MYDKEGVVLLSGTSLPCTFVSGCDSISKPQSLVLDLPGYPTRAHTCNHTHTNSHARKHTLLHIHTHAHPPTHTNLHTDTLLYIHARTHTYTHIHKSTERQRHLITTAATGCPLGFDQWGGDVEVTHGLNTSPDDRQLQNPTMGSEPFWACTVSKSVYNTRQQQQQQGCYIGESDG